MNKIGEINFKKINRISPSQFYSMKNCAYKFLLAEAFDKKPLLPLSPNAYFGTVLHKMLELIAKGIVKSDDDFNAEFDKQVKNLEDELQQKGLSFFIPIKLKVRDFGLKKIQLKKYLQNKTKSKTVSGHTKLYSEKWLESRNKLIGGKVDLIIENGSSVEIIDFKTGAVTQDCMDDEGEIISEVKNGYKEQLKLYAYLYFENTNKFPTSLSVTDLSRKKFPVEFSEQECKTLFDEAKNRLKSTNDCISTKSFSANPKEENCKFCLYRPACSFFHKKIESDFSFNDVLGEIEDLKKFQNGNMSVFVRNGDRQITIKNFSSKKYDELNSARGKHVIIYNLRKEAKEFIYYTTQTTVIYEQSK